MFIAESPRGYKTGFIPSPPHKLLAAMPFMALRAAPPQFALVPKQLSFWGNQNYGCCVTSEEAFAKACYNPEVFIPEEVAVAWANAHGVLNGADPASVLDMMTRDGFVNGGQTYEDGGKLGVNYADEAALQSALSANGPVKIGIDHTALPANAGPPNGWWSTGSVKKSNPDHCISIAGYGPTDYLYQALGMTPPSGLPSVGYLAFTWSSIGFVTHDWIMSTTVEAWVRNPTTIIVGNQPSPTPPTPIPPPAPSQYPTQQQWDTVMNLLINNAPNAIARYWLSYVKAFGDWVYNRGGFHSSPIYRTVSSGFVLNWTFHVPPEVVPIIDAAFDAAAVQFPDQAVLIKLVKAAIDAYLPKLNNA